MTKSATARATALWRKGVDFEELMAALRAEGHSKIDSIAATSTLLRVPLSEAKRLVHFSSAWSDVQEAHERFHDVVEAVAASEPRSGVVSDDPHDIAQRLVGVVTALRGSDIDTARQIIAELLESAEPEHVVILSGALTAALAEIAHLGEENLVEALGILVAVTEQSAAATMPLERATAALAQ